MYCDSYDNIRSNIMLQHYFLSKPEQEEIVTALQKCNSKEASNTGVPQTLVEFSSITGLSEQQIISIIEAEGMSLIQYGYTLVTVFTRLTKFRTALKREFNIKEKEEGIIDRLVEMYLEKDGTNNEIPLSTSSELNMLGWAYNRFKMVVGGVGTDKERMKTSILTKIDILRRDVIKSELEGKTKEEEYKLPLLDFLRLSEKFDEACGTVGNHVYKKLLDVLIVLDFNSNNAIEGKPYVDMETIDYSSRSGIETMVCKERGLLKSEKGFNKQEIIYTYDSNNIDTSGKEGIGLKIQTYFGIVNRILTTNFKTLFDFVTDISSFSNEIRENYFRVDAGTSDSMTHIVGASYIKPIPSQMVEEICNMGLEPFILNSHKKNKVTGVFEKVPCLLVNSGLEIMIGLSSAPHVFEKIRNGLKNEGRTWYDLLSLRNEYEDFSAKLPSTEKTILEQYRELRYLKEPDTNYIAYRAEGTSSVMELPYEQITRVELMCDLFDNPNKLTLSAVSNLKIGELDQYTPEEIQADIIKAYDLALQINLMPKIDAIREIVEGVKIFCAKYNDVEYSQYSLMLQIAYDGVIQQLNKMIEELRGILTIGNVLKTQRGQIAITMAKRALSSCSDKFESTILQSKFYGAEFVSSVLEDEIEKAIKRDKVGESLSMVIKFLPVSNKVSDSRYLIGRDTFYRSKMTNKLIIQRISEDLVSVKNSVVSSVEFRKENGVWHREMLSRQE